MPFEMLTLVVKDSWRNCGGKWRDNLGVSTLANVEGTVIDGDVCDSYRRSSILLYGDMHRLLPAEILEGPPLWQPVLTEYRYHQHSMWVKNMLTFQSTLPCNYQPPKRLEELRASFTNRPGQRGEVLRTQVVVRAAPQPQDK